MLNFKILLPVLVLLIGGVAIFFAWIALYPPVPETSPVDTSLEVQENPARNLGGFEHLISITTNGFEPSEPSARVADTIRFTNNSSEDVWIEGVSSIGNPPYPEEGECGDSAFDSCKALAPGEFWEFKFRYAGTWLFRNKLNIEQVGVVYVKE